MATGTDYRGIAPEKDAVSVSPYIGIYQDGFGSAISQNASGFGQVMSNMDQDKQQQAKADAAERRYQEDKNFELNNKLDFAYGMVDVLDTSEAEARNFMTPPAEGQKPLGPKDIYDLQAADRDVAKAMSADVQKPGAARTALYQSANLRKAILNNPYIADELLSRYTNIAGSGIVQQLDDVQGAYETKKVEEQKKLDDDAFALGVSRDATNQQKLDVTLNHNSLLTRQKDSEANLAILRNHDALSSRQYGIELQTNLVPGMLASLGAMYDPNNQAVRDAYRIEERSAGFREEAVAGMNQKVAEARNKVLRLAPPGTSSEQIEAWMAPITQFQKTASEYLSGQRSIDSVRLANEGIKALAENRLNSIPGIADLTALGGPLDKAAKAYPGVINQIGAAKAAQPILALATAVMSNRYSMNQMALDHLTPAERKDTLTGMMLAFDQNAKDSALAPNDFQKMLSLTLGQYGQATEEEKKSLVALFPTLTSDDAIAKLAEARDPATRRALVDGAADYTKDLVGVARTRVENGTKGMIEINDPNDRLPAVKRDKKDYLTVSYGKDGTPHWDYKIVPNMNPWDVKSLKSTASDLNQLSQQFVGVYKLHEALGSNGQLDAPAFVKLMVEDGRLPAEFVAAQRRKEDAEKVAAE